MHDGSVPFNGRAVADANQRILNARFLRVLPDIDECVKDDAKYVLLPSQCLQQLGLTLDGACPIPRAVPPVTEECDCG